MVIPAQARNVSTATGNTSVTKIPKTRVFLEYPCYICGDMLSRAKNAIDHANRIHGFDIPSRLQGRKRPQDDFYEYIRDRNAEVDEMHYSCASCWFHCPEDENGIQTLNAHVRQEHDPIKVDESKEGDDVTQVGTKGNSRRLGSVDPDGVQRGSGHGDRGRNQTSESKGSTSRNDGRSDGDDKSKESSGDQGRRGSSVDPDGVRRGSGHGDRGRNQTSDTKGGRRSSKDESQSDEDGGDDSEREYNRRSATPLTEEGAKEISSKLDELTSLFKRFFFPDEEMEETEE